MGILPCCTICNRGNAYNFGEYILQKPLKDHFIKDQDQQKDSAEYLERIANKPENPGR